MMNCQRTLPRAQDCQVTGLPKVTLAFNRWALKKIAIYGGSFDPVHHAHLILAREAIEILGLEKVILVPAAISPLKKAAPVASGEIRLAMLRAAIKSEPEFEVDECELRRPPPSYTIDTIRDIHRRERDAEICCLIGEDNVEQLPQWSRFPELAKMVRFVVLDRTGKQPTHSYQVIHRRIDISATEIRRRVAQNESIRYLVPESVEKIIQREKLYREQSK
jgi:nicotinate-nucleotide adenylyltransferase